MTSKKQIDSYIITCTTTFKTFDYEVIISKNKANLWHFAAKNRERKYLIYCAPQLTKVKSIIKIALKKVPADSRLVVICDEHSDEEAELAESLNYSLITIKTLQKYGVEMIDAKTRELEAS